MMAIGIIVLLLTIPLITYFGMDTDIIGATIFTVGLAICLIGIIKRKQLHRWKLVLMAILAALLCLPLLSLIVSLIYTLIMGEPMGD